MKTLILLKIGMIIFCNFSLAQNPAKINPKPALINKDNRPIVTPKTLNTELTDITIYEQPNFTGRQGRFKKTNGSLTAPFEDMSNVSFSVPTGKIVYISTDCNMEFPTEIAYTAAQTAADLNNVCSIRSDDAVLFPIQFNGISTIIHNNDCKRIFGEVSVSVYEKSPRNSTHTYMQHNGDPAFTGVDRTIFSAFSHPNSTEPLPYEDVFYDEIKPFVVSNIVKLRSLLSQTEYVVGATALTEGRVAIKITSKIGSAHKTCDLCDDFTSNVVMPTPVTETIFVNSTKPGVKTLSSTNKSKTLGPYRAEGTRDGTAITASGGIFVNFSLYFTFFKKRT